MLSLGRYPSYYITGYSEIPEIESLRTFVKEGK